MKYWIEYKIVRTVASFLELLSIRTALSLARKAGSLFYYIMPHRKKIALANLDRAFGDKLTQKQKNRIARHAFQNVCLSLTELFLVKKIRSHVDHFFTLSGREHLEKAFQERKGVVLVIAHLGSWEYLAFLPLITSHRWSVIVKEIRNPFLNNAIDSLRRVMTVNPIQKQGSIKTVMRELKQGHGVAILIDQWAGSEGMWVNFFDNPTSTTSVPARLARRTGSTLVPAYCLREPNNHYRIVIEPPVSLDTAIPGWEKTTTEKLNELLEEKIRDFPEQWVWTHRRWKPKPQS